MEWMIFAEKPGFGDRSFYPAGADAPNIEHSTSNIEHRRRLAPAK
jgi:hypothetical protein